MTMTRRRLLDDTFKKSVVGKPAIATDSLARMYPGIVMNGWTTQDGTPTPETPVPIVSAGTQNQDTGKWEYEITIANAQTDPDKNQTVTLTADRPLTKWDRLVYMDGQWQWEYGGKNIVLNGSENWAITLEVNDNFAGFALRSDEYNAKRYSVMSVCDKFSYSLSSKPNTQKQVDSIYGLRFYIGYSELPNQTVAEFKKYLENNPVKFIYQLSDSEYTPLQQSEQTALNTLYTFRPTTVLSNDAGCNMALTYKTRKSMEVTT